MEEDNLLGIIGPQNSQEDARISAERWLCAPAGLTQDCSQSDLPEMFYHYLKSPFSSSDSTVRLDETATESMFSKFVAENRPHSKSIEAALNKVFPEYFESWSFGRELSVGDADPVRAQTYKPLLEFRPYLAQWDNKSISMEDLYDYRKHRGAWYAFYELNGISHRYGPTTRGNDPVVDLFSLFYNTRNGLSGFPAGDHVLVRQPKCLPKDKKIVYLPRWVVPFKKEAYLCSEIDVHFDGGPKGTAYGRAGTPFTMHGALVLDALAARPLELVITELTPSPITEDTLKSKLDLLYRSIKKKTPVQEMLVQSKGVMLGFRSCHISPPSIELQTHGYHDRTIDKALPCLGTIGFIFGSLWTISIKGYEAIGLGGVLFGIWGVPLILIKYDNFMTEKMRIYNEAIDKRNAGKAAHAKSLADNLSSSILSIPYSGRIINIGSDPNGGTDNVKTKRDQFNF